MSNANGPTSNDLHQGNGFLNPSDQSLAHLIKTIQKDYETITPYYTRVKIKPWKDLLPLLQLMPSFPSASILDHGGGNGRNSLAFPTNTSLIVILDLSLELLKHASISRERVCASLTHLPFRQKSFHRVLSIAVLHHLPDTKSRKAALHELRLTLSPKAIILLTVWKRDRSGMYARTIKALLQNQDPRVYFHPWKSKDRDIILHRKYFLFTRNDLYDMLPSCFTVLSSGSFGGKDGRSNYFLLLEFMQS